MIQTSQKHTCTCTNATVRCKVNHRSLFGNSFSPFFRSYAAFVKLFFLYVRSSILITHIVQQNVISTPYRPISRVVIGREVDYRSRLKYARYCKQTQHYVYDDLMIAH